MDFMELIASEIIERIKSHLSPKELDDLGFSTQIVSSWKLRDRIPKSEDLYKIAQAIGVSMEYLLTGNDENELPPDKIELLKNYDLLSEARKTMVQITVSALAATK